MEKRFLLLIFAVVAISIVASFFAGASIGVAPLRILGVEYWCPRWKCTTYRFSSSSSVFSINSSKILYDYTFTLLGVWSSPNASNARVQLSKGGSVIETFFVRTNITYQTTGGNVGIAYQAYPMSWGDYNIYVRDGETNSWALIEVKDRKNITLATEIMQVGSIVTIPVTNTTLMYIKLLDVWTSAVSGSVTARLIVGDRIFYVTILDGANSWALLKISAYYQYTYYFCSYENPGGCSIWGSCRYCPI